MEIQKGCVYFFKHVGLSPIKIGYSENESPLGRFNEFKTYAPFGVECLGFITTSSPNSLERELHKRFSAKRLEGEWFDITIEEVNNVIENYSSREQLKEISDFQFYYMKQKEKQKENNINKQDVNLLTNDEKRLIFLDEVMKTGKINKVQFSNTYKISRQTLHRWHKDYKQSQDKKT